MTEDQFAALVERAWTSVEPDLKTIHEFGGFASYMLVECVHNIRRTAGDQYAIELVQELLKDLSMPLPASEYLFDDQGNLKQ